MNDIERARQRRIDSKKKWRPVTNELVVSHANPDCKECKGAGALGDAEGPEADSAKVCQCAEDMFAIAYRGRLRHNAQRNRLEVFV